jgi:hypothetical protein
MMCGGQVASRLRRLLWSCMEFGFRESSATFSPVRLLGISRSISPGRYVWYGHGFCDGRRCSRRENVVGFIQWASEGSLKSLILLFILVI